uniref:ADF-H domain-containing protein n=1 Tax=Coccolithus braarudii TaxID=221442 RepID=A0A7S0LTU8_9EUKA|mmetsp:Transcript_669/g.1299  ORF Transcript_669/g.1299 Transcript_669/m.1299 type:complete len:139 (+) Transcript_669:97-513(+)|eukprot:CAMPEP_0183360812 /NCGR_PEP_ID=MMETSP0164_2-20130417/56089_1 /TAXON_ID=221442 /ORGANISM="Coccolithus pelagicus ssp braarudi, Strain PLY182g" /LENGTH=138 /DNA_ID=CAMNT_0025535247 /DNA_START=84 /DNA_END=500 /DNA_ORIENTATION=+
MVTAGFKIPDDSVKAYNELQGGHKHSYLIFKIDQEQKAVVLEESGKPDEFKYDEFAKKVATLDSPRFIVIDFKGKYADGRALEKVVFIFWCPDGAKIKERMLYASTKEDFKRKMNGLHKTIEASDESDIEYKEVISLF